MKIFAHTAEDFINYNQKQTVVGSPLRTLKGSVIKRSSKYGVGKEIGGNIYVHKDYMDRVVPQDVLTDALVVLHDEQPDFQFNTIKYDPKSNQITFFECPGFDTEREPVVGDYIIVFPDDRIKYGHSNSIYHSKWLFVKNDYRGFNVSDSWEWSRKWLSTLQETADGINIDRWSAQLDKYGLPHDTNR